jgi:hypothetical protein
MGLIRDDVLAAARRGREMIAAGIVALARLWLIWRNKHPGSLPERKAVPIRQKGCAGTGGQGNASRFPARSGTTAPQDHPRKRNAGQRPARRGRSARRGRGGRWPGALAPGGLVAQAPHGRGNGPGQNRYGELSRRPFGQPPGSPRGRYSHSPADPVGLVLFADPQQVQAWG